ncbi:MAG: HAMP domain-containing histidine kinase [Bryobacterales bacterium]|jgi:signal transduction histidine kinase|nr:HAMP domain-containing histidine kinase [Bryobacterales bacterium]
MIRGSHRRSIPLFIAVGSVLVGLAVALNIGWIVISWREGLLLAVGVVVSLLIVAGVVLNTIFLVREIRRNEQQDGFLNAVTHELKTPVASIRLYLETLQSRVVDEATRAEFYRVMMEDTQRLQSTIEQVLMAGAAGAAHSVGRQPLSMRELTEESVALCRARHHLGDEHLQFDNRCVTESRSMVMGNREDLLAALRNLLENAVKYSGKHIRIVVTLRNPDSSRVQFQISDEGVGMSASETKRIFKRFYRIPSAASMRVKGTGLGLFIVAQMAKRHGGRAFAESEGPGRGSIFTLELPVAPLESGAGLFEEGAEPVAARGDADEHSAPLRVALPATGVEPGPMGTKERAR